MSKWVSDIVINNFIQSLNENEEKLFYIHSTFFLLNIITKKVIQYKNGKKTKKTWENIKKAAEELDVKQSELQEIIDEKNVLNSFSYSIEEVYDRKKMQRIDNRNIIVIPELKKVFIPFNHKKNHWTLFMVDVRDHSIQHFDSLSDNQNESYTKYIRIQSLRILQYVTDNFKTNGSKENIEWEFIDHGNTIAQQLNSDDCGVYMCMFLQDLCSDKKLLKKNYTQSKVDKFREKLKMFQ